MSIYEFLKHKFIKNKINGFLDYKQSMYIGFVSGFIAAILTNPLDVIKTNIMTSWNNLLNGYFKMIAKLYKGYGA